MNEPFKGFWNRLHSFVANVEVNDAMSEEEKCMILSVCNTEVKNLAQPDVIKSLPKEKGKLLEYLQTTMEGRHLMNSVLFPIANHFKTHPEKLKELGLEIIGNVL